MGEESTSSGAVAAAKPLTTPARVRAKILAVAAAWIVVLLYVAQAFLPPNIINLPNQSRLEASIAPLAPQGWAFFTKPPREPRMTIYAVAPDGGQVASKLGPNGRIEYAWGLSRTFMLQQSAAAQAAAAITAERWQECDERETLDACVDSVADSEPVTLSMPRNQALACGEYVFAMSEAIPFAWRNISSERERALGAVHVSFRC